MRIELVYFKDTGKYYTDGFFKVPDSTTWDDVKAMVETKIKEGNLPGLVRGAGKGFSIVMMPHENTGETGVPHLFVV